jgi:Mn2+/Fe2+ NRAMP family transporter
MIRAAPPRRTHLAALNRRDIMGERVNSRALNVLGWLTTAAVFAATFALVVSWII